MRIKQYILISSLAILISCASVADLFNVIDAQLETYCNSNDFAGRTRALESAKKDNPYHIPLCKNNRYEISR